jgi:Uma2 family endonuclease
MEGTTRARELVSGAVNRDAAHRAPTPVVPAGSSVAPFAPFAPFDWSHWYLRDEDDVGQSALHWSIANELANLLEELARERGWLPIFIGGDQFVAWVEQHSQVRVSPDVYIIDDPPARIPPSWQTWLPGHRAPRFAVEVVSDTSWDKDYVVAPEKYGSMGVNELVIADPHGFLQPGRSKRVPLQVHRRLGQNNKLTCVAKGAGPVHCAELGAYLLFCKNGRGEPRVRISRDSAGRDLVLKSVERADAEASRADAEASRAEAAEARVEATAVELDAARARAEAEAARARAAEELLRKHGLV